MHNNMRWAITALLCIVGFVLLASKLYPSGAVFLIGASITAPPLRQMWEARLKRELNTTYIIAVLISCVFFGAMFANMPKEENENTATEKPHTESEGITKYDANGKAVGEVKRFEDLNEADKKAIFKAVYACDKSSLDQTTKELGKWSAEWEMNKKEQHSARRSELLDACRGELFKYYAINQRQFMEIEMEGVKNKWDF